MPDYEPRELEFTLFKNNYKKEDKHPVMVMMKDDCFLINGRKAKAAVWSGTTKNGKQKWTCKIQWADQQEYDQRQPGDPIDDTDIPI